MMKMEDFSEIINWDNVLKQKEDYQNKKPFRFTFIENFFKKEFYEKKKETFFLLNDPMYTCQCVLITFIMVI